MTDAAPLSTQKYIPKLIHISERSRCVNQDMYYSLKVWETQFPTHSVFFHDDNAVDKLLAMDWPEFPDLHRMMPCVTKGAMKVDLWRVLVLWKFGGLYSDADNLPTAAFNESIMHPDASFFSLSDAWDRSSQWLFGTAPGNVVLYNTMHLISSNVLGMPDISKPRLVFTTGPHVLGRGHKEPWRDTLIDRREQKRGLLEWCIKWKMDLYIRK